MNYHSKFSVGRGRQVGIVADGPLDARHIQNIIRMLSIDLEIMVEAEADSLQLLPALIDRLPPFDPGSSPEHMDKWFEWFGALWTAAEETRAQGVAAGIGSAVVNSPVGETDAPDLPHTPEQSPEGKE